MQTLSEWVRGFKSPEMFPTNISNADSAQAFDYPKSKVHQNTGVCTQNFKNFPGLITPNHMVGGVTSSRIFPVYGLQLCVPSSWTPSFGSAMNKGSHSVGPYVV